MMKDYVSVYVAYLGEGVETAWGTCAWVGSWRNTV
jgi:hypothetical protein